MKLKEELKLKRNFSSSGHEALLSIVVTASLLLKFADKFFGKYGITGTQFNILKMLREFEAEGLSQQELSQKLVVTKSNVVGLIDRMEKSGYVRRKAHPTDRRFNLLGLTAKGRKLVDELEVLYFKKINELMSDLPEQQKQAVITALENVRENTKRDKRA